MLFLDSMYTSKCHVLVGRGQAPESSVTSSRLERGKSQARTQQDQGLNLAICTLELPGLELDNLQLELDNFEART